MKITRHSAHLIQLTKWGMMNCYLVREEDGFTLIDAAVAKCELSLIHI